MLLALVPLLAIGFILLRGRVWSVRRVVRDSGTRDRVKGTAGTIRGDYALDIVYSVVRGSEAPESASGKIKIFFPRLG